MKGGQEGEDLQYTHVYLIINLACYTSGYYSSRFLSGKLTNMVMQILPGPIFLYIFYR